MEGLQPVSILRKRKADSDARLELGDGSTPVKKVRWEGLEAQIADDTCKAPITAQTQQFQNGEGGTFQTSGAEQKLIGSRLSKNHSEGVQHLTASTGASAMDVDEMPEADYDDGDLDLLSLMCILDGNTDNSLEDIPKSIREKLENLHQYTDVESYMEEAHSHWPYAEHPLLSGLLVKGDTSRKCTELHVLLRTLVTAVAYNDEVTYKKALSRLSKESSGFQYFTASQLRKEKEAVFSLWTNEGLYLPMLSTGKTELLRFTGLSRQKIMCLAGTMKIKIGCASNKAEKSEERWSCVIEGYKKCYPLFDEFPDQATTKAFACSLTTYLEYIAAGKFQHAMQAAHEHTKDFPDQARLFRFHNVQ